MGPSVAREIACPPEVAWRLLTHVEEWPRWGPTVAGGSVPGGVISSGARGTVRTVVGVSLPFVVSEFEPGRSWAWRVAKVPATKHRVTATDGGCVVAFEVPWWAPGYLAVCALALVRIERLATGS